MGVFVFVSLELLYVRVRVVLLFLVSSVVGGWANILLVACC